MEYTCSICKEKVQDDLLVYIKHTETHIIDEIKSKHPEWQDTEGVCRRCEDYYREQLKG